MEDDPPSLEMLSLTLKLLSVPPPLPLLQLLELLL
jgi:hypothetical protein